MRRLGLFFRCRHTPRWACTIGLVFAEWLLASSGYAGPNANGTLVAHDAGVSYTDGSTQYPTPPPPGDPPVVDNSVEVGAPPDALGRVWKVYAVFPSNGSPRLKALVMGQQFGSQVVVLDGGLPDALDFEVPQNGWPTASGSGVGISFWTTQTGRVVECYWFGGYGAQDAIWAIVPHPVQPMIFVDDSIPPQEDAIAGLSTIGFGVDGHTEYPLPLPEPEACCFAVDGHCEMKVESTCLQLGGEFLGGPCDPNPCPQPPSGACCFLSGVCAYLPEYACSGIWYSEGSVCDPNPCPQPPFGACCSPDGSCAYLQQHACGGAWYGPDSICDPNPCPPPMGACCHPDGTCVEIEESGCGTGDWREGEECHPNPCPIPPPVNAGGVLVVHDTGLAYTDDLSEYPSEPPLNCDLVDSNAPIDSPVVWKVYAAFPEENSPRLKALAFGESFDPAFVTILDAGLPGPFDFEVPQYGWPNAPGGGVAISFGQTQTGHMVEVYWFGGYGASQGLWATAPHPAQATGFVDDSVPPREDPIAGLGSIGFGLSGEIPCGVHGPGACCYADGSCSVLSSEACAAGGGSYVGGSCHPNPCPPPPSGSGETLGTAIAIPSLPIYYTGQTCSYINDYDEACPYGGSTSPDLVYRYVPPTNNAITIDLCASSYDTKVYVYRNSQEELVACNDDAGCGYSGWQSRIEALPVHAGDAYYIVIDGYGGSCGTYTVFVESYISCSVECPPGSLEEGEPPCVDHYYDQYDGGCNGAGWYTIMAQAGGCATLCGRSCTYFYSGSSYRDTDWYTVTAWGGAVTYSCVAEFPLLAILIYGLDCNNLAYVYTTAGPCETANLSWTASSGQELWLWAGPSVFSGVPESDYTLQVCGIQGGATPTIPMSWGAVKMRFAPGASRQEGAGGRGDAEARVPRRPSPISGSEGDRHPGRWGARAPTK